MRALEVLVGALHHSTAENLQLCQQLSEAGGLVRMLPTQPSIGDTTRPMPPSLM
ncbi:hypothetical protein [Streptomyces sp. MUSC 14]|uniref:hypothetical protein n=1 Tax=Streptomyces sp. MUSC 14 TaxID=1354889 RepID=UPI0015A671A3|nr:hypothetical protein [Streptomyces sp. MUSC 14]